MQPSVLVIAADAHEVSGALGARGLRVSSTGCQNEGLSLAAARPDVVLLCGSWAALVPSLRARTDSAVLLLGCADEACVELGVSHGADDFVSCSTDVREISLRVRAALARRSRAVLTFDELRGRFRLGDRELDLSVVEQALFTVLFEHVGFACTRDELTRRVWPEQDVRSRTIDNHVMRLREKLGPGGRLVESVRGVGYRLSREALPR